MFMIKIKRWLVERPERELGCPVPLQHNITSVAIAKIARCDMITTRDIYLWALSSVRLS